MVMQCHQLLADVERRGTLDLDRGRVQELAARGSDEDVQPA